VLEESHVPNQIVRCIRIGLRMARLTDATRKAAKRKRARQAWTVAWLTDCSPSPPWGVLDPSRVQRYGGRYDVASANSLDDKPEARAITWATFM